MPNDKKTLRADIRRRLPAPDARPALSARIREHILAAPVWSAARAIGLFLPMADEVNLAPLALAALDSGRLVAVPANDPDTGEWSWRRLHSVEAVNATPGSLGAPQPANGEAVDRNLLDLILVPARAVDRQGNRLGRGAGIYDRLLPGTGAKRIAVVFASQMLDSLPAESHDVPVQAVVTENGMREFLDTPAG